MAEHPLTNRSGRYITTTTAGETVRAFLPAPLPPHPTVDLRRLQRRLERASQALGRLDGLTRLLPDPQIFIYLYVRKEAVLSSQIEETQSSLSDLLAFEAEGMENVPLHDVAEVSSYVAALEHGLQRVRHDLPLSLRLLREIHSVLLRHRRGADKMPGEFRRSQNWIGGTRPGNAVYVPPPPDRLIECLDTFEKFLHRDDEDMPVLVKAGMAHVQFETIHPFLDGNNRVGRLLITLMLCADGLFDPTSRPLSGRGMLGPRGNGHRSGASALWADVRARLADKGTRPGQLRPGCLPRRHHAEDPDRGDEPAAGRTEHACEQAHAPRHPGAGTPRHPGRTA
jgi:fido (protein-threonine AMPylation protein)